MKKILLEWTTQDELRTLVKDLLEESFQKFLKKPVESNTTGYFTRHEVAKHLRISLPTLHEYTKHGIITGYRIGGRVLYKVAEIEKSVTAMNTLKYRRNG
jgi:excisionase family DNA binding protein